MRRLIQGALLVVPALLLETSTFAATRGVQHYLYVANDDDATIDVFDVDNGHQKVRSFDASAGYSGKRRYRGITAHPGTARLYVSDSDDGFVAAFDLLTDKLVWKKTFDECTFPDRLNITKDGQTLYIPCKKDPMQHVAINAETGEVIQTYPMDKYPHNSFTGESGKYMYMSAYRNDTLFIADANTHELVKKVSGFTSGIRPFTVDKEERFFFATVTNILGFSVGDIENEKKLFDIKLETPKERTKNKKAGTELSHGGQPKSHGIAIRPGTREIWFNDDKWGYLYAYDTSPLYKKVPEAPVQVAMIPLFTDITKKWTTTRWRWVNTNTDGRYIYPASGIVVDAETKKITDMKITPSEKLIGIDFSNGKPVAAGGQNGGYFPLQD
ncbi:MAG: YncE family protein [Oligoflexales bacterium]